LLCETASYPAERTKDDAADNPKNGDRRDDHASNPTGIRVFKKDLGEFDGA
jgi:hypothetical protein